MSGWKEVAKSAFGAEAVHVLRPRGRTVFGVTPPRRWNIVGLFVNAGVALFLGLCAGAALATRGRHTPPAHDEDSGRVK